MGLGCSTFSISSILATEPVTLASWASIALRRVSTRALRALTRLRDSSTRLTSALIWSANECFRSSISVAIISLRERSRSLSADSSRSRSADLLCSRAIVSAMTRRSSVIFTMVWRSSRSSDASPASWDEVGGTGVGSSAVRAGLLPASNLTARGSAAARGGGRVGAASAMMIGGGTARATGDAGCVDVTPARLSASGDRARSSLLLPSGSASAVDSSVPRSPRDLIRIVGGRVASLESRAALSRPDVMRASRRARRFSYLSRRWTALSRLFVSSFSLFVDSVSGTRPSSSMTRAWSARASDSFFVVSSYFCCSLKRSSHFTFTSGDCASSSVSENSSCSRGSGLSSPFSVRTTSCRLLRPPGSGFLALGAGPAAALSSALHASSSELCDRGMSVCGERLRIVWAELSSLVVETASSPVAVGASVPSRRFFRKIMRVIVFAPSVIAVTAREMRGDFPASATCAGTDKRGPEAVEWVLASSSAACNDMASDARLDRHLV
eukprot:m.81253 g.81253  ORF g.81253 m.81253 type:complete len:498 (+) comp8073_c1_seq3:344-1837(+)